MNETVGPESCVPSTLVFGVYPSLNIFDQGMNQKAVLKVREKVAEASQTNGTRNG